MSKDLHHEGGEELQTNSTPRVDKLHKTCRRDDLTHYLPLKHHTSHKSLGQKSADHP